MNPISVHALEGAMLSNATDAERLLRIASEGFVTTVFVVSPVTSPELSLEGLLASSRDNDEKLWSRLEKSQNAWIELSETILSDASQVEESISQSFSEVEDILRAVWILRDTDQSQSRYLATLTSSFISLIFSEVLRANGIKSSTISAREAVDAKELPEGALFVTGDLFIPSEAFNAAGKAMKEGGSEYTASLIAAVHDAPVTFWNSRSPLCSASRRDVPSAPVIKHLTYAEATELSFFGAPIIHPQSFQPSENKGLPVYLRCWKDYDESTEISSASVSDSGPVKAFSVVRGVALVNVEGSVMSGVPGFSSRLFTALRNEKISVILISQASSEYSICFAVPEKQAGRAEKRTSLF